MIRVKIGVCGTKKGMKCSKDGAFSLSAAEEAYLVNRGVAEYVNASTEESDEAAEGKSLDDMSMAELRALCKEHDVALKANMTKAAMVDALLAVMEQAETVDDISEEDESKDEISEAVPMYDAAEAVE